ncbi:MAG TPA: adenylate/guanylate cyclase domain-containing protein [Candidatus Rifleibacterium sp.]|nr:adenylate/guanylate cyclase domain-containing protein [Candidatus Rifleibacterium sp.]
MSTKFSSFDAMTRQNKINALMNIKKTGSTSQVDYYLVLHAILCEDIQVAMAAKMALPNFAAQSWYHDFGKPSNPETAGKIETFLRQTIGFGPELHEIEEPPERQQMAQNLARRQKRFENFQEWEGTFPPAVKILNTLREDTQQLLTGLLNPGETFERCWLGLYSEALQPFREIQRSLDSNTATMIVNLSRVLKPSQIDPSLGAMFRLMGRPAYLLILITGKRCMLFLRDEIGTSQAAVLVFNLQSVAAVRTQQDGLLKSIEIETHQDFIKLPQMMPADADDALAWLQESSIDAIEATEEFIDRDFEKELKKLDMLFKAHAIVAGEYHFRKSRLQKMELEKFSDANIELLLARRFSGGGQGERFDEQLLKKFTFEKTVMFTDIVGFSTQASQKMLLDTMTLLALHDKMLMPVIKESEGVLIKKIGDALMVRFDDPLKACAAAMEMQMILFEFNRQNDDKIFIRIGLNTGTVFVKNDDVFGDAVNIAARMESIARPGRIYLTESTMQKLDGRLPVENLGPKHVKGREEPITVFSLVNNSIQADEMAYMANDLLQKNGIQTNQPEQNAPEKPSYQDDEPAAIPALKPEISSRPEPTSTPAMPQTAPTPESFPEDFLHAVDQARSCYVRAVKEGRQRNPDLEDWFARFEALLRHEISG